MPPVNNEFAISAPTVFDGERFLADHCVIVQDQTVTQILPAGDTPAGTPVTALQQGTLAPGLIDLQVNGGGGLMLNNNPHLPTLKTMLGAHRAFGTTSMLPTIMSDAASVQQDAAQAVLQAVLEGEPGVLGIHIEGPFFNPARRGAHQADMIRPPQQEDIDWLCSLHDIRVLLTLAPEQVQAEQIERLASSGIILSAGHTNASYRQIEAATARGLQGITHLFNAMSPIAAREPGTVGAALDNDPLWAGIIADGHHVHPANIRLAHRAKPPGKLLLVSDAMATVNSASNSFELYGETIREEAGKLVNSEGKLAGSAIGLIQAVHYAHETVGLPLDECLRMASLYPAAVLELDNILGRIATGYRADLVHFDEQFVVCNTWLAGQQQRHR